MSELNKKGFPHPPLPENSEERWQIFGRHCTRSLSLFSPFFSISDSPFRVPTDENVTLGLLGPSGKKKEKKFRIIHT